MLEIKKEAELCELFMRDLNALDGWTCYPETGGFDILAVHDDGRQIGIEAKLTLNAKVADQIMPEPWQMRYGKAGPDHRLVIVSKITDASQGIAKLLGFVGVPVLEPRMQRTFEGDRLLFCRYRLEQLLAGDPFGTELFDWNPEERCQVPMLVANLPAGVPAPIRLTPWKEKALRAIALMRHQGHISTRQLGELGLSLSAWTRGVGPHPGWLIKGPIRGQWLETEHLPNFTEQHPDAYALAVAQLSENIEKQIEGFTLV